MDPLQSKAIVEALVFAADEPVSLEAIAEILEVERADVETTLTRIREDYEKADRGLRLSEVAGGFRFTTRPDYQPLTGLAERLATFERPEPGLTQYDEMLGGDR